MTRRNYAIFNDENELEMIKDNYRTRKEAEEVLKANGLENDDNYFVGRCDDIEED